MSWGPCWSPMLARKRSFQRRLSYDLDDETFPFFPIPHFLLPFFSTIHSVSPFSFSNLLASRLR